MVSPCMKRLIASLLAVVALSAAQGKQTFTGTITAGSEPMDLSEKKIVLGRKRMGVYFQSREGQKGNLG